MTPLQILCSEQFYYNSMWVDGYGAIEVHSTSVNSHFCHELSAVTDLSPLTPLCMLHLILLSVQVAACTRGLSLLVLLLTTSCFVVEVVLYHDNHLIDLHLLFSLVVLN